MKTKIYRNWESVPEILTAEQASALLQVNIVRLRKLASDGGVPGAFKIGKLWRFDKKQLMTFAGCAS